MNYGKAVEEVWEWRETVAKELNAIPREKRAKYLNTAAKKACKKLHIKCRTLTPNAYEKRMKSER
jgi:DNA repair ATPase RecN